MIECIFPTKSRPVGITLPFSKSLNYGKHIFHHSSEVLEVLAPEWRLASTSGSSRHGRLKALD